MSYLDRVLHDGRDRDGWLRYRRPIVGASDAAKLARESSVESVLASKLSPKAWTGNKYTESGHRWEPMMLAWAGIPENKALIHSPGERGFAATPDGAGGTVGAECKAKHGRVVDGPSLGEWRQLAWQFVCVPEFESIEFIWVELIDNDIRAGLNGEPKNITVRPSHPKIRELTPRILPLATDLLARLTAALEFERELSA